eukprot:31306_5
MHQRLLQLLNTTEDKLIDQTMVLDVCVLAEEIRDAETNIVIRQIQTVDALGFRDTQAGAVEKKSLMAGFGVGRGLESELDKTGQTH